ncbi:hypothetical protein VTK26DRAFT_2579 [Humicola hyalothermophila]
MEFRQVVHSVCRTAAAATARPSLLAASSTRPSAPAAALFLQQLHQFTTSSQKPSVAAAVAAEPQHSQPQAQQTPSSFQQPRYSHSDSRLPPRPPPIRNSSLFGSGQRSHDDKAKKLGLFSHRPDPSAAAAQNASSSSADAVGLLSQIKSNAAESTLTAWDQDLFLSKANYQEPAELRLVPSTGRTVHVRGKQDVASALRRLEREVAINSVRRDAREQRFYERPALKRKRLLRERWRQRFKDGFYACLQRTRELKRQGW